MSIIDILPKRSILFIKRLATTLLYIRDRDIRGPKNKLIILDDIFPHLLSAFRVAEFNVYLKMFAKSEIYSTAESFRLIAEKRDFFDVLEEYEQKYPEFKSRVFIFNKKKSPHAKLAYLVFLNNAYAFIDYIDKNRIPFVFTLYPGGGFDLDQELTNQKLQRVLSSPYFRKVITTQKITYDYLRKMKYCDIDKVEFIYGGVFPIEIGMKNDYKKKIFKLNKETFDICFVAQKYSVNGIDKGYDVFVDVAKQLSLLHRDIRLHVVGPYDESDIDVAILGEQITFYGVQQTDFFAEFYKKMDIILSPNIPFVLGQGSFDGFPTGCCIEAGSREVAVFCTDVLHLNTAFKDRAEIVIVPHDAKEIVIIIDYYYRHPEELYDLAVKGKHAFSRVFGTSEQMNRRLHILSKELEC